MKISLVKDLYFGCVCETSGQLNWQGGTMHKRGNLWLEPQTFSCAGIDCWDGEGKGGFCLICLKIRSRLKGGMDEDTKKQKEKKLLIHFGREGWDSEEKKSSQPGCEKKRCGVVKAGSYFNQGGEWVRWGNCVSEISFLERRHNGSICSFSKLYRFNFIKSWPKFCFRISNKIQHQNLDQTSASKPWPKFNFKILTWVSS